MYPILLKFGPITLYTYGAMMVAAFLAATTLAAHAARRLPKAYVAITPEQIVDFSCAALLGGLLGGRLFFVLLHWEEFARAPREILALWHGGLVWYGGFLGGLAGGWGYVRARRLSFCRALDQYAPFLALGHAIGRIGCFFNGCCYGKPTEAWCGVVFPGQSVRVVPTQLIEATCLAFLFILLRNRQRPSVLRHPGRLFGGYLAAYAAIRFVIEFLRGDQAIWWYGLTLQQIISIGIFLIGCILLFRVSRSTQNSTRETRN